MSTLQVTTIQSNASATLPVINDSAGTEYGRFCRAFVTFTGATSPGTIRASFNVSSVTKNGTGDYTVNLTNALTDGNYSCLAWLTKDNELNDEVIYMRTTPNSTRTSSAMRLYSSYGRSPAGNFDAPTISVSFFR